jgi:HD-like signal output (HDOD) protein
MKFNRRIEVRIKKYHPKGGLDSTTRVLLDLAGISIPLVRMHQERVALMAEAVAKRMKKDSKAAFFAGLLHDPGKISISSHLFDGRDITAEEYAEVKKHAIAGFIALKRAHLFTAYCAGLHHALYERGYGLEVRDFPKNWQPRTVKKVLEIATIIAICDDIDASLHRKTTIKDDGRLAGIPLVKRLKGKFPDDQKAVEIALEEAKKYL